MKKILKEVAGERKVWLGLDCCPHKMVPDKRQKMDGCYGLSWLLGYSLFGLLNLMTSTRRFILFLNGTIYIFYDCFLNCLTEKYIHYLACFAVPPIILLIVKTRVIAPLKAFCDPYHNCFSLIFIDANFINVKHRL